MKQTDGLGHDLRAQKLAGQSLQMWTAMLAFAVPPKLTHLLHHAYLQRRWRRTKRRDVFLSWASGYLRLRFLAGERESCRWCWWRQPDTSLTSYGCCHCPSAQSGAPPRIVTVKYHDAALCTQEVVVKKQEGLQRVTGDIASEFSLREIIINLPRCTNITYYSKLIRQW